jgi:hypothetical protein
MSAADAALNPFERLAIKAALTALARESYFSICIVDKVLDVCGIGRGGRTYRALSLLHCVHYGDMDAKLLEALPNALAELFAQPVLDFDRINIVVDQPNKRLRIVQNG